MSTTELNLVEEQQVGLLDIIQDLQTGEQIKPSMLPVIFHALDLVPLSRVDEVLTPILNAFASPEDLAQIVTYIISRFSPEALQAQSASVVKIIVNRPLGINTTYLSNQPRLALYSQALVRNLLNSPNFQANVKALALLADQEILPLDYQAKMIQRLCLQWVVAYQDANKADKPKIAKEMEKFAERIRLMTTHEFKSSLMSRTSRQNFTRSLFLSAATLSSVIEGDLAYGMGMWQPIEQGLKSNGHFKKSEKRIFIADLIIDAWRVSLAGCPVEKLDTYIRYVMAEVSAENRVSEYDPTVASRHDELILSFIDAICQRNDVQNLEVQQCIRQQLVAKLRDQQSAGSLALVHQFFLPCFIDKEGLAVALIGGATTADRHDQTMAQVRIWQQFEQGDSGVISRLAQTLKVGVATLNTSWNMQEILANLLALPNVSYLDKLILLDQALVGLRIRIEERIFQHTRPDRLMTEEEVVCLNRIVSPDFVALLLNYLGGRGVKMQEPLYWQVIFRAQTLLDLLKPNA